MRSEQDVWSDKYIKVKGFTTSYKCKPPHNFRLTIKNAGYMITRVNVRLNCEEFFMDKQSSSSIGSTKVMATIAVMTALTCIFGPLSIPIGPIPISLTPFCVFFSVYVLGMKKGTIAVLLYLLIGLAGVPVFSGFTAGPAKLFGPTGGYLIGFILMALISGYFIDKFPGKYVIQFTGMILGLFALYALGTQIRHRLGAAGFAVWA